MSASAKPESDPELIEVLRLAQDLGFVGPGSLLEHIDHGRAFADAVVQGWSGSSHSPTSTYPGRVADLGSGGGLPALVIGREWPEARLTLVEAQARRATFLREAVERLALEHRVEVVEERAELLGRDKRHRGAYEVVTARAFGRPAVTAECAAPLLERGGILVVSEPPEGRSGAERWPELGLGLLGMGRARSIRADLQFAVVHQAGDCPERYPRRVGIPAKRPLF